MVVTQRKRHWADVICTINAGGNLLVKLGGDCNLQTTVGPMHPPSHDL